MGGGFDGGGGGGGGGGAIIHHTMRCQNNIVGMSQILMPMLDCACTWYVYTMESG